jgi:2-hydroxychromene-2-carboxylate isomerase
MSGARAKLVFLFDYISPYAYLASTQIHALAARHDRDVELVPILFAALLDANGQKGPAEIPSKRDYIWTDLVRTARALGVRIEPPPSHPFNPLLALRATLIEPMEQSARRKLVELFFAATWAGGGGVTEQRAVATIAKAAGLDGDAIVKAAFEPPAKQALKRTTDDALAKGVFGVPTVIADGELFWGVDSLANLERFLRGEGAIDEETLARWKRVTPSATRPRS